MLKFRTKKFTLLFDVMVVVNKWVALFIYTRDPTTVDNIYQIYKIILAHIPWFLFYKIAILFLIPPTPWYVVILVDINGECMFGNNKCTYIACSSRIHKMDYFHNRVNPDIQAFLLSNSTQKWHFHFLWRNCRDCKLYFLSVENKAKR